MSGINLNNPQVLSNFIRAKIKEGKGELYEKKEVYAFKDESGFEYWVPEDLKKEVKNRLEGKDNKKVEVKKEEEKPKEKSERDLIKEELDKKGVEYKGNAKTEELKELLKQ